MFLVTFVSDTASRHKKTCVPVARPGKAKAREQCHGCSTSIQEAMPNKRAFGTDLTNIDNKRGKLDSTAENKVKLMQGA